MGFSASLPARGHGQGPVNFKAVCFRDTFKGKCQFFSQAPQHQGRWVHSMRGGGLGGWGRWGWRSRGSGGVASVRPQRCGHALPLVFGSFLLGACPPKGAS